MILDIIIVLIILAMAAYGFKKGFMFSLIHSVGWVASFAFAYLLTPAVEDFLRGHTNFYEGICASVAAKMDVSLEALDAISNSLPAGVYPVYDSEIDDMLQSVTHAFSDIFCTVLVFVMTFFVLKIITWLALKFLAKNYKDGFVSFADGLFGTMFGIVKGVILVLVLLALVFPMANLMSTGFIETITHQLDASYFAKDLYDQNLILILLQGYFGQ